MEEYQYELLLGKKIDNVKVENSKFNLSEKNYYSVSFIDKPKPYDNNYIYFISIQTDDKKTVLEVDIKLNSLVDKSLYGNLVQKYGVPSMILVPDKVTYDKSIKDKKINATVRKTMRKTKQGTFEDNPTFIIWQKEPYKVEVLMKYEQNMSEISFKNIDDSLISS